RPGRRRGARGGAHRRAGPRHGGGGGAGERHLEPGDRAVRARDAGPGGGDQRPSRHGGAGDGEPARRGRANRRLERGAERIDGGDRQLGEPAGRGGGPPHRRGEVVPAAGGRGAAARAPGGRLAARGSLVDQALAVGTIEPRVEVSVKSILAGVVRQRFAGVGDFVKRGQPLLEISPNPTPLEMVELRRNVELREIDLKNVERELSRQQQLRNQNLISPADLETAQRQVDESRTQFSLAQERLALQEGGKVLTGGKPVETVVRAPIDGYILEDSIEI